jgi:CheY-like chemotaxis protein
VALQSGTFVNHPLVLVVEDEPVSQRALVRLLQSEGYDARGAGSAEHALKIAADWGGPIIALVDFNLPGMDGLEFISLMAAQGNNLRVILITASGHDEVRSRATERADVIYLQKPMNFSELLEILAREVQR